MGVHSACSGAVQILGDQNNEDTQVVSNCDHALYDDYKSIAIMYTILQNSPPYIIPPHACV